VHEEERRPLARPLVGDLEPVDADTVSSAHTDTAQLLAVGKTRQDGNAACVPRGR
jgi:hypothetical protein